MRRGLFINAVGGLELNAVGRKILDRGGDDSVGTDEMLLLECVKRAPGMSIEAMQQTIVSLLNEYGEDTLKAIQSGHVQFQLDKPGSKLDG